MKYEVQENCLTIFLPGELDHHNAEEIRKRSDYLIDQNHIRYVIFDFTDTTFMDSSGIGFITRRFRNVYDRGGQAFVINSNDRMERLLTMSGIFKIVTKAGNFEEAYRTVHTS